MLSIIPGGKACHVNLVLCCPFKGLRETRLDIRMKKSLNMQLLLPGVILMAGIFLLEINTGILAGTVAYILIVLYVLWFSRNVKFLLHLGLISSALIVFGYFFSSQKVMSETSIMLNRSLTLVGVWLAVYIAFRYRSVFDKEVKLKRQLKALFENATEGIVFIGRKGTVTITNPQAAKMFGYATHELIGRNIESLLGSKSDFRKVSELLLHPEQASSDFDWWAFTKQGKNFPVEINLTPIGDGEQTVIAFIQDATSKRERAILAQEKLEAATRYNAELEKQVSLRTQQLEQMNNELSAEIEDRKMIEQRLQQSQQIYSAMAHHFPEGVIGIVDNEMQFIFGDGEGLMEMGLSYEHIRGKRMFADIDDAGLKAECEAALRRVYGGEKVKFDFDLGSRTYNTTAVPLQDGNYSIREALVVIKDITHRKNIERELRRMLEKERELNTLKSRFVTTASHEFRTPLTTILSSASLLEKYDAAQMEEKRAIHLTRIKRSVRGLTELLNEFLSLGKLEEGKIAPSYTLLSATEFLKEVVSEVELLKKGAQKIRLRCSSKADMIETDRQILKNILINILSNAIKYSPPGSEIELNVDVNNEVTQLEIADQGIGIPDSEQCHIFERFFRARNAIEIQGTGLGLNIVKKYVDLLQGDISFRSRENHGTVFTITLPVSPSSETATQKAYDTSAGAL